MGGKTMGGKFSSHKAITRGVATNGRYACYYCERGEAMKGVDLIPPSGWALVTLHDKRGCYHLCWPHATWRMTTSAIGGHSSDCPHRGQGTQ
jgi:hypothetical protein